MMFFWLKNKIDYEQQSEEKIDYSYLSDEDLLDSFKSDSWSNLDERHRVAVVQEMENRNAAAQGRDTATVVSMDDRRYYGQYNAPNNTLSIDVTNVSSYETLDTYVHETNHAYQEFAIKNGSEKYDDHTITMMKVEMARDEHGKLYNYATKSPEYDIQCDELDSNNKAASYLLAEKNRYGKDPKYRDYIKERVEHYKKVSSSLKNESDKRVLLQKNQIETARIQGDISDEEYETLKDNILNLEFQDETVEESYKVGDAVIGLNIEYELEKSVAVTEDVDYMGTLDSQESNGNTEDYGGSVYEENSAFVESSNDNVIDYD